MAQHSLSLRAASTTFRITTGAVPDQPEWIRPQRQGSSTVRNHTNAIAPRASCRIKVPEGWSFQPCGTTIKGHADGHGPSGMWRRDAAELGDSTLCAVILDGSARDDSSEATHAAIVVRESLSQNMYNTTTIHRALLWEAAQLLKLRSQRSEAVEDGAVANTHLTEWFLIVFARQQLPIIDQLQGQAVSLSAAL